MPKEVELKIRLDPEMAELFGSLETLRDIEPRDKRFHTAYFDLAGEKLHRKGFELRVRKDGDHRIQTLKSGDGVERGEWEAEIAQDAPEPQEIEKTPAATLIRDVDKLRPVFSLSVNRRIWTLARDGADIEVALDRGAVEADGRAQQIHEAELELKSGPASSLYELADEISDKLDAPLSFVGKGCRGYRLAHGEESSPEHDIDLRLDPEVSAQDAFATIVDSCLRQLSINEELLRAGIETEPVHQARVAIRRLRAAFSMFKEIVTGKDADRVRDDLKWISDLLGASRDKDVFLSKRMKAVELGHPGVPGLEEVRQKIQSRLGAANRRLEEAIHSRRFRNLLLALVRCAREGEWTKGPGLLREARFSDFAACELQRRLDSVAKKKKAARGPDALKRHRLRIKAKKLRYMVEFFKPVSAGDKRLSRISDDLEALQDLFGALNDAIAAERLLGQIAREAGDPAVSYAAALIARLEQPSPDLLGKAVKIHSRLRGREPFRVG
jgi:triphosphatase